MPTACALSRFDGKAQSQNSALRKPGVPDCLLKRRPHRLPIRIRSAFIAEDYCVDPTAIREG